MTPLRDHAFVAWLGIRACAGVLEAASDVVAWTRLA